MKNYKNLILACASLLAPSFSWTDAARPQSKSILSPVYSIDKIYRSMEGPSSSQKVFLLDSPTPELLWITGFRTEMMQEDGQTPSKPELMCHVNLDFDPVKHEQTSGALKMPTTRLLTLSQGQLSVTFPKGFGVPIVSNEELSLTTQVLNLNDAALKTRVRHRVVFDFVRDRDLKKPMKALFNTAPFVMSPIDSDAPDMKGMQNVPTMHGDTCLPADAGIGAHTAHQHAPNARGSIYHDPQGRTLSGHWVVPPGKSEVRTDVTNTMALPSDTTLHYAAVHLHPFAESLELRDLTARKTVFKSLAHNSKGRIGLDAVDYFSSVAGVRLYKSHSYELVSVYNNPTAENSDSMAVMLLFLHDKDFKKPSLLAIPAVITVFFKTSLGDFTAQLDAAAAPKTVQQFAAMARAGIYNGAPLIYVQPGFATQFGDKTLLPAEQALVVKLPLEISRLKHQRGVLSMARDPKDPNSAQRSFCIVLGNAGHLDGHYTAFGRVVDGLDKLSAFEALAHDEKGKPATTVAINRLDVVNSAAFVPQVADERFVLHTESGDMTFRLFPGMAPKTVAAISRMAAAGVFDSTHFGRLEPQFALQLNLAEDRQKPLTAKQRVLIANLPAEFNVLKRRRGMLSMAPADDDMNSAETSFSIMLGDAPRLEGRYTIFGELESGQDALDALEKSPLDANNKPAKRLTVRKAEIAMPMAASCHLPESGAAVKPKAFAGKYIPATDNNRVVKDRTLGNGEMAKEILFKNIYMDRLYPSMLGPWTRTYVSLIDPKKSPSVWVTAYRAEVLEGGTEKASQEYMCHTKMDTAPVPGSAATGEGIKSFFVISQGQDEVRFPQGFALRIPNTPDRQVDVNAMVLNNNNPKIHKALDFKVTISYLDEQTAITKGTIPLLLVSGSVYCPRTAAAALPGETVCEPATEESPNNPRTGHWLAPPGRHHYKTASNITAAFDTRIHYILMHVHPYAESMILRDKTTGQTVWIGKIHNATHGALIKATDFYSSADGLPVHKGHEYELEVVYNNRTARPVDAMASIWVYVRALPA